jgi:hypothetical protein
MNNPWPQPDSTTTLENAPPLIILRGAGALLNEISVSHTTRDNGGRGIFTPRCNPLGVTQLHLTFDLAKPRYTFERRNYAFFVENVTDIDEPLS